MEFKQNLKTQTQNSVECHEKKQIDFALTKKMDLEFFPENCIICFEKIRIRDFIWACKVCSTVLHFSCMIEWTNKASKEQTFLEEFLGKTVQTVKLKCLLCKTNLKLNLKPTCLCGDDKSYFEEKEIPLNFCGRICLKNRHSGCALPCPESCHYSRCRPCTKLTILCFCLMEKKEVRGCQKYLMGKFSCENPCKKQLSCQKHFCGKKCHSDDCAKICQNRCLQLLNCRKHFCNELCHSGNCAAVCKNVCDRPFSCLRHFCEDLCHQGPCPKPFDHACEKKLPCQKHICKDLCHKGPCNQHCDCLCLKPLNCGKHFCLEKCHFGDCQKTCREICERTLDCGNHNCDQLCHKEDCCHSCKKNCGKPLKCQKHFCPEKCHKGECGTCTEEWLQEYFCGSEKAVLHCGRAFSCEKICHKLLNCGNHVCKKFCHRENKCQKCSNCSKNSKRHVSKNLRKKRFCQGQEICVQETNLPETECSLILPCGHICQLKTVHEACFCVNSWKKMCLCGKIFPVVCTENSANSFCSELCIKNSEANPDELLFFTIFDNQIYLIETISQKNKEICEEAQNESESAFLLRTNVDDQQNFFIRQHQILIEFKNKFLTFFDIKNKSERMKIDGNKLIKEDYCVKTGEQKKSEDKRRNQNLDQMEFKSA